MTADLHSLMDPLSVRQDYLWFGAWLAWLAVALVLATHRPRPELYRLLAIGGSIQWIAATMALVEHVSLRSNAIVPETRWAFIAAITTIVHGTAVVWIRSGESRRRGLLLPACFGLALTILVGWQLAQPTGPGIRESQMGYLAALLVVALGTAWASRGRSWSEGSLLWLFWLGLVLSPHGPAAVLANESKRWLSLSLFSLPAAIIAMAGGLLALSLILENRRSQNPGEKSLSRRAFAQICLCFLLGLPVAELMGHRARQDFERSLLARAQAFALAADRAPLARWLDRQLILGQPKQNGQYFGGTIRFYEAPAVNAPEIASLRAFLARLEQDNPDLRKIHIDTLRDGELLTVVLAPYSRGPQNVVVRHGPATSQDLAAWENRRPYFAPPFMGPWGDRVRASAPLVGPESQMLGWLTLDAGVTQWTSVQAQARLQTFALVALGLVLLLLAERQKLRAAQQALAQAEAQAARLADEAKSVFLAQVSHELRTPLQGILGFGELLRGSALGPEQRHWLTHLTTNSKLLERLVEDLLDVTSMEAGTFKLKPAPDCLPRVVHETADSFRRAAKDKNLDLIIENEGLAPEFTYFDALRIRQVVHNLVSNAVKYTQRGAVTVRLSHLAHAADVNWILSVRDTGSGIAPDDLPQLFRPFSRLASTSHQEGFGLGLHLSRMICRSLGGNLTATSDDSGSIFTASWSLASGPLAIPAGGASLPADPLGLAGIRVLVVDDNAFVRELFTTYLRSCGAIVDTADLGETALARCAETPPDALVLDLSMPGLDGYGVAQKLRTSGYTSRIVGASAHAGEAEQVRAQRAGMDIVLTKPVELAELAHAIRPTVISPVVHESAGLRALRIRLRSEFASELPTQLKTLGVAVAASDWPGVERQAHLLKNSADVVQLRDLAEACAKLEQHARREESAPAALAAIQDAGTAFLSELLSAPIPAR